MSKAICKPLLALIFAVVSVPYVLADAHPGLKNAIDKGDYKTAQNLKQKMNVRGYYLPAALSIKDAEFIYGPLTRYKWLLGLDHYDNCSRDGASECSPEFIDKYIAKICSGTTEFDVTACIDWMKSTKMNDIGRYKENFCRTKENIRVCSLYVSMLDWNEQLKYLNDLDKKGLVEIPIITEIDTVVKEKVPKKECLAQWNDMYKVIKASIKNDSRYRQSRGYFYEAIICSFDGSAAKEKKCLSYLDEFSTMMKKECSSGKMEKDVSKKMKVKRLQKPFEDIIRKYSLELEKTPWFEMDEEWSEKIRFVQKYEKKEETEIAKEITDYYASYGDILLSEVKKACVLFPAIDKFIEKNFGVNIFLCSEIFNEYPNYVGNRCEVENSSWIKRLAVTSKDSVALVCDKELGKFRIATEPEASVGLCDENVQKKEIFPFFVCLGNKWEDLNKANTDGLTFNEGEIKKGIMNQEYEFFKDERDSNVYRVVRIGEQIWMAENSRFQKWSEKCASDDHVKYGCYYTWYSAQNTTCPEGWHLPTKKEWEILAAEIEERFVDIQARGFENWPNATDAYGFSTLPAGSHNCSNCSDFRADEKAYFWSASESNYSEGVSWDLYENGADYGRHDKASGLSVRCVQD